MFDVNKITSVLERLPDSALQQYAAMHKQDPYTLALAVEESNRRKRMRAAPQQAAQNQMPVNDQIIQSMAPEDTGIAQLPAGDMTFSAADGGIVAFAGGTPSEGVTSSVFDYLPDFLRARLQSNAVRAGALPADGEQVKMGPRVAEMPGLFDFAQYLYGGAKEKVEDFLQRQVDTQRAIAAAPTPATAAEAAAPAGDTMRAARTAVPSAPPAAQRAPASNAGLGAISTSSRTREKSVTPAGAAPQPVDVSTRIQQVQSGLPSTVPGMNLLEEGVRTSRAQHQADIEAYKRDLPQGTPMAGLKSRLEKEEADTPQKREENLKMALVTAGLGMLAGTSQYAMANIGAGGAKGVQAYKEGIDKLDKAAERRQELFAKVEQAERAEKENRAEKALALRRDVAKSEQDFLNAQVAAVQAAFKVDRDTAVKIVDMEKEERINAAYIDARREIARLREAGEAARAKLQTENLNARERGDTLRFYGTTLTKELDVIQRQIKELPMMIPERRATDPQYLELKKRETDLIGSLREVQKALAPSAGVPTSAFDAPKTSAGSDGFGSMTISNPKK